MRYNDYLADLESVNPMEGSKQKGGSSEKDPCSSIASRCELRRQMNVEDSLMAPLTGGSIDAKVYLIVLLIFITFFFLFFFCFVLDYVIFLDEETKLY
jgi:hypothetical protein